MMIELPAVAPFNVDIDLDDMAAQLSPKGMLGRSDEIYEGGIPGWKQNPDVLGAGLLAFIRELKPLADTTPKIPGEVFMQRLRSLGFDTAEVQIVPEAIRHDTSIGDEGDDAK